MLIFDCCQALCDAHYSQGQVKQKQTLAELLTFSVHSWIIPSLKMNVSSCLSNILVKTTVPISLWN